jgi:hypothetical protein
VETTIADWLKEGGALASMAMVLLAYVEQQRRHATELVRIEKDRGDERLKMQSERTAEQKTRADEKSADRQALIESLKEASSAIQACTSRQAMSVLGRKGK